MFLIKKREKEIEEARLKLEVFSTQARCKLVPMMGIKH